MSPDPLGDLKRRAPGASHPSGPDHCSLAHIPQYFPDQSEGGFHPVNILTPIEQKRMTGNPGFRVLLPCAASLRTSILHSTINLGTYLRNDSLIKPIMFSSKILSGQHPWAHNMPRGGQTGVLLSGTPPPRRGRRGALHCGVWRQQSPFEHPLKTQRALPTPVRTLWVAAFLQYNPR